MLASTMQFSSNERPRPHNPTPTPTPAPPATHTTRATSTTTAKRYDQKADPHTRHHALPTRDNTHPHPGTLPLTEKSPRRRARLFPQDPTACHDPPPCTRTARSHHPRETPSDSCTNADRPTSRQASCRCSTLEQ